MIKHCAHWNSETSHFKVLSRKNWEPLRGHFALCVTVVIVTRGLGAVKTTTNNRNDLGEVRHCAESVRGNFL